MIFGIQFSSGNSASNSGEKKHRLVSRPGKYTSNMVNLPQIFIVATTKASDFIQDRVVGHVVQSITSRGALNLLDYVGFMRR